MQIIKKQSLIDSTLTAGLLLYIFIIYGALPFIGIPTLGHALWSSAFAQSFANGGGLSIYAENIGVPYQAAISFGLAGAWIQSIFIRLGLIPADAYSCMNILWLTVAFFSAYKITRKFNASRKLSLLAAATWLSLPIGWGHTGFSMLSLGIALLPFYFLSVINLHIDQKPTAKSLAANVLLHAFCCIISVFMDGYTFMMFALGTVTLTAAHFTFNNYERRHLAFVCAPVHTLSFTIAYLTYRAYIGESYPSNYSGFFAITGINILNLLVPNQDWLILPQALKIGPHQSSDILSSTFILPALITAIVTLNLKRTQKKSGLAFLCVATVAIYFSLGTSLKIPNLSSTSAATTISLLNNSIKDIHLIPTGSEWIYKNVPGFNNMRVTFRWIALAIFMLWLSIAINLGRGEKGNLFIGTLLISTILINTPDLSTWLGYSKSQRDLFIELESNFVAPINELIKPDETVAFLPWGNDVVSPYTAARGGYKTYNIGGDKNVLRAKPHWPIQFRKLGNMILNKIDSKAAPDIYSILNDRVASSIIIPNINKLWGTDELPCASMAQQKNHSSDPRGTGLICPYHWLHYDEELISTLHGDERLDVTKGKYFTLIRMK